MIQIEVKEKQYQMLKKSISSTIKGIISGKIEKVPHCLWHLTKREWSCIKDYYICLTELFVGDIAVYNNVSFRMKVKAPLKKTTAHGNTIRWKEINLSEVKGGYVYITATIPDLQAMLHMKLREMCIFIQSLITKYHNICNIKLRQSSYESILVYCLVLLFCDCVNGFDYNCFIID